MKEIPVEELETKPYIATIVRKIPISNETFIFVYSCTKTGTYYEDSQQFMDSCGNLYSNINSCTPYICQDPYACANVMSLEAAKEKYGVQMLGESDDEEPIKNSEELNKNAILSAYDMGAEHVYYLCKMGDDEKCLTIKYNYEDVISSYWKRFFSGLISEEEPSESDDISEYDKLSLSKIDVGDDLAVDKLLTKIESGELDLQQLAGLAELLAGYSENIEIIVDAIKDATGENDKESEVSTGAKLTQPIDVNKLLSQVTKTLVAQNEPAKEMIVEIARRDLTNHQKLGILLTGETGVGKTALMSLIAKYIERPFLIVDTTQLSSPGYEGLHIEEVLWRFYRDCGYDIDKVQHAIIYFDEIDKKGSERKDDVSGTRVLNLMLKFLDGTTYVATDSLRDNNYDPVDISTNDMLVIAGGAFTDVYGAPPKNPLGFSETEKEGKPYVPKTKDFVEKAMMSREFMGRFPTVIRMNPLTQEGMMSILLESDESPIKISQEEFEKLGVEAVFTDGAIVAIANAAIESKIGARGLRGIVNKTTNKAMGKVMFEPGIYSKVTITEDTVKDPNNFDIIKKETSIVKRRASSSAN